MAGKNYRGVQSWQDDAGLRLVRYEKGRYEVRLTDGQVVGVVIRFGGRYLAYDEMDRFLGAFRSRKKAALKVAGNE